MNNLADRNRQRSEKPLPKRGQKLDRTQGKRSTSSSSDSDCTLHLSQQTHTRTYTHKQQSGHAVIRGRSACNALVKSIEAVKYCRSRCSSDVQLKPADHIHPTTQQCKQEALAAMHFYISVSCSRRNGELTHPGTGPGTTAPQPLRTGNRPSLHHYC